MYVIFVHICCRAPRGARGLKFKRVPGADKDKLSRPARGAWIEIQPMLQTVGPLLVAPREGRVD